LKRTEYYERWGYDFRQYRDILAYAQAHGIPLVALNAPAELVAVVSRGGLADLSSEDRGRLPADLSPPDTAYQEKLRPIFEMHEKLSADRLRRFAEVQVLWDEHMARVARDYLDANPGKTLVILAGSGHVAYQDAIPGRLARMTGAETAVVATGPCDRFAEADVDFVLAERDIDLPEPGRVGMMLARDDRGVTVTAIPPASPAGEAGFRPGDLVLSIAGEPVQGMDDVRLALLDRAPGEQVWVEVVPSGAPAMDSSQGRVLTLL
jgi:C-terminal processing protease CtpA/Prc